MKIIIRVDKSDVQALGDRRNGNAGIRKAALGESDSCV